MSHWKDIVGASESADVSAFAPVMYVAGAFTKVGAMRGPLARVDSSGTTSLTYSIDSAASTNTVTNIASAGGDQVFIASDFGSDGWLKKLLPSGEIDSGFNASVASSFNSITAIGSGKHFVVSGFSSLSSMLNADGSADGAYSHAALAAAVGSEFMVSAAPAGQVYVSGRIGGTTPALVRLLSTGAVDPSFSATLPAGLSLIAATLSLASGKVLVAAGNASQQLVIFRLTATGASDGTFSYVNPPSTLFWPSATMIEQAGGKIVLANLSSKNGNPDSTIRIQADGAYDGTFVLSGTGMTTAAMIAVRADGKMLFKRSTTFGVVQINADGSPDATFAEVAAVASTLAAVGATGNVVLTAGRFDTIGGASRSGALRTTASGILDPLFIDPMPSYAFGPRIERIQPLENGSVMVVGDFSQIDGLPRNHVARLFSVGSVDPAFPNIAFGASAGFPFGQDILIEPDGRMIVSGFWNSVAGVGRSNVARLSANGVLETDFVPHATNGAVHKVFRNADGTFIIGGEFTTLNGVSSRGLGKLAADGTRDASYTAHAIVNDGIDPFVIRDIIQDGTGYIVFGRFRVGAGLSKYAWMRVDATGAFDAGFASSSVSRIDAHKARRLPNGRILVVGNFGAIRLLADGTIDPTHSTSSVVGTLRAISVGSDNLPVIGGDITSVSGKPRLSIAKLNELGQLDTSVGILGAGGVSSPISDIAIAPAPPPVPALSITAPVPLSVDIGTVVNHTYTVLGGNPPYTLSVVSGAIPAGLNISGLSLVGTVTAAETASFDIMATDVLLRTDTVSDSITVTSSVQRLIDGRNANGIGNTGIVSTLMELDGTLVPGYQQTQPSFGAFANVTIIRIKKGPDGKIYLGGAINGKGIVRLNADGTLDSGFSFARSFIDSFGFQSDGKIIAGGSTVVERFNTDGTVDATFTTSAQSGLFNTDRMVAVQPDNKVLIGGGTGVSNEIAVWRFLADGGIDGSWSVPTSLVSGQPAHFRFATGTITEQFRLNDMLILPSGQILTCGFWTNFPWRVGESGTLQRGGVARINTDGSVDQTFFANGSWKSTSASSASPKRLGVDSSGNIWVAGGMRETSPPINDGLTRMTSSGSAVAGFTAPTIRTSGAFKTPVTGLVALDNGGCIIAATSMATYNGASVQPIVKVLPDGSRDATFTASATGTNFFSVGLL
jgi:uncharacterized delta-60 repeat protein